MLSRALTLAAVTLLVSGIVADQAGAQVTNLEAGKSPSQIFAGTCTACHKAPRGLLKTVPGSSLQSFLRQHYTTSPEMASLLAAFLISSGAADTRYGAGQSKPGKDDKLEVRPAAAPEQLDRFGRRVRPATQEATRPDADPRQVAKPDTDGPTIEFGRSGRNARRLAHPEPPAVEGQPAEAVIERGPDGRRLSAKQRLGKRNRPSGEEPPKTETGKTETGKTETGTEAAKIEASKPEALKPEAGKAEAAKNEGAKDESQVPSGDPASTEPPKPGNSNNSESVKVEPGQSGGANPAPEESKSEPARVETPRAADSGEQPARRADPVPAVTPAPAAASTISASGSNATPESAAGSSAAAPTSPGVTVAAPPPVPAGPPAPPISQ